MSDYVILFGIRFNVNPVAFTLPIGNGWSVYWYGIIIALGFAVAVVVVAAVVVVVVLKKKGSKKN